jgi:DNA (cytosine-5)-methyltransferase 1
MRLADHAPSTIKRFQWIQDNCRSGVVLRNSEIKKFKTKKQVQVVLEASKPSHTLTTLPDDLLHYSEPRILTVREFARLQSFPDWFQFRGKYTTGGDRRTRECPRYTQVGNAVAPLVAQALGNSIVWLSKELGSRDKAVQEKAALIPRRALGK